MRPPQTPRLLAEFVEASKKRPGGSGLLVHYLVSGEGAPADASTPESGGARAHIVAVVPEARLAEARAALCEVR